MPTTISEFVNSVRYTKAIKDEQCRSKTLSDRIRDRQYAKRVCTTIDHLQGRAKDIRMLLRHVFITTPLGNMSGQKKHRTSMDLDYIVEMIDAEFLYSKDDRRNKLLQFAQSSDEYEIIHIMSHTYIRIPSIQSFW